MKKYYIAAAFILGISPFTIGQTTTTFNSMSGNPLSPAVTSPGSATVEDWTITVSSPGNNVSILRVVGPGGSSDYIPRAVVSTPPGSLAYVGYARLVAFKLLSLNYRYSTRNGVDMNNITITGYRQGSPVTNASFTQTAGTYIGTSTANKSLDVSAIAAFGNIDEFRLSMSGGSGINQIIDIDNIVFQDADVLPIKLESFTARRKDKGVLLKWTTGEATNFSHFDIERSTNGIGFSVIKTFDLSDMGNSYQYHDGDELVGKVYYRLRMVDIDGSFSFSAVVNVRNDIDSGIELYPNPASSVLKVSLPRATNARDITIRIIGATGQPVVSRIYKQQREATAMIPITIMHLSRGVYFLQINGKDFGNQIIRFVKQ